MASAIVIGGAGRMGRLVRAELLARGFEVTGSYDVDNVDELDEAAPAADVALDFSAPAALPHTLAYARRTGAAVISGVTGLTEDQLADLRTLGETNRVIWASNYSLGVAALRRATALVAGTLADWDVEIVETHHNQKADAPSGTAKALVAAVDPAGERPVVGGREGLVGARVPGGDRRPRRARRHRGRHARGPLLRHRRGGLPHASRDEPPDLCRRRRGRRRAPALPRARLLRL